jgi:hypothetical protein
MMILSLSDDTSGKHKIVSLKKDFCFCECKKMPMHFSFRTAKVTANFRTVKDRHGVRSRGANKYFKVCAGQPAMKPFTLEMIGPSR